MISKNIFNSKTDILQIVLLVFFTCFLLRTFLRIIRYINHFFPLDRFHKAVSANSIFPIMLLIFIINILTLLILTNLVYFHHYLCDFFILLNMIIIDYLVWLRFSIDSFMLGPLLSNTIVKSVYAFVVGTTIPIISIFDISITASNGKILYEILLFSFLLTMVLYLHKSFFHYVRIVFFCLVTIIIEAIVLDFFIDDGLQTKVFTTTSRFLTIALFISFILSRILYIKMELHHDFEEMQEEFESALGLNAILNNNKSSLLKFDKLNDTIAIIILIVVLIVSVKLNIIHSLSDLINSFISTDITSVGLDFRDKNFFDNAVSFPHAFKVFSLLISCVVADKMFEIIDNILPTKNIFVSLSFKTILGIVPTYFITTYLTKIFTYLTANNKYLFLAFIILEIFIVFSPVIGIYTGLSCFFITLLTNILPINLPSILLIPILYLLGIFALSLVKIFISNIPEYIKDL